MLICSDEFCVLAGKSRQVEIHFVSSLVCSSHVEMCPRFYERVLVIPCCGMFCVLAGKRGVWSTQVEIHLVSSLA